jgi:ribosomal protein L29
MATTKPTTKKPAAKPAKETKSTKKTTVDYQAMSHSDLEAALVGKREDLSAQTRSHKAGELVNPRVLGQTRRDIARIHTAMNQQSQQTKSEDK